MLQARALPAGTQSHPHPQAKANHHVIPLSFPSCLFPLPSILSMLPAPAMFSSSPALGVPHLFLRGHLGTLRLLL